jgi:tetratricopeptide (TPR) repeat protein
MKVNSASESIFCTRCGSQIDAEDAYFYYDLKHADQVDIDSVNSYDMLVAGGKTLLEQRKYDRAELCFQKASEQEPENYFIWKLRAYTLESMVVNQLKQSFYYYDKAKKEVIENKPYIDQYKDFCQTAVRNCPSELSEELAEEFNDRLREHFSIAMTPFNEVRKRHRSIVITAAMVVFCVIALGLRACRM